MKTRTIILLIGFFLFALSVTMYSSSTDKPTSFLSIITIVFAAISASVSVEAVEQAKIQTYEGIKRSEEIAQRTYEETLRSLKQTRLTIEKAENERQMREIEDSLKYFYSPLRVYLDKDVNRYNEEFGDIFRYTHLAADKTVFYPKIISLCRSMHIL